VVDPQSTAAMLDAMAHLICDTSTSLDSFVSGPALRSVEPLGTGGELLHAIHTYGADITRIDSGACRNYD
jgi:hypothetical protein